ncbi:MAG: bifunctional phosphoglucose/phosphomannose isomerase [bacterium]
MALNTDELNSRKTIREIPKQFAIGLESAKDIKIKGNFNKLLVCAMGGSALPAGILEMVFQDLKIKLPIYIHRNYNLPSFADKNSLIICISYSGNTGETLSSFKQAVKKNLPLAAICSGGKLAQLCQKHKIPFALVPIGYQPRMALAFQFSALIKILKNSQLIKINLKNLSGLEKTLKPESLGKKGKTIASALADKIPVIYTSDKLKNLALIWKNKINETAKTLAIMNSFPELNHNEMTGFTKPQGKFHVVLLRDLSDHPKILKRMEMTVKIIKNKGVAVNIVDLKGKDVFSKIFSGIILADWVSHYLASIYKVSPISVQLQEDFKKKMNES